MEDDTADKWITRQELADRYGVPVKTPAEWASKGTGPRYAKVGRHVRYLSSDVFEWDVHNSPRTSVTPPDYDGLMLVRSDERGSGSAAFRRDEE